MSLVFRLKGRLRTCSTIIPRIRGLRCGTLLQTEHTHAQAHARAPSIKYTPSIRLHSFAIFIRQGNNLKKSKKATSTTLLLLLQGNTHDLPSQYEPKIVRQEQRWQNVIFSDV